MRLRLSETEVLLRDTARSIFERHATYPRLMEVHASDSGYDAILWSEIAKAGWLGLASSGQSADLQLLGLLLKEFGRAAVAAPFYQTACATLTLARLGQRVPSDAVAAVILEPARLRQEAGGYRLSGGPYLLEWAAMASVLLVPVRIETRGGIFLVAVRLPNAGLAIPEIRAMDNERMGRVHFDNVEILDSDLITPAPISEERWASERRLLGLLRACEMVGGAARMLELTVEYVSHRIQFDRPIGSFQAVQHACADMKIRLDGAELATAEALWKASCDESFAREGAVACYFTGQAATFIAVNSAHLHGGIGFTTEYPLHFYFRRAKAQQLRLGPVHLQLEAAAAELLYRGRPPLGSVG